ncbi:response regulator [Skermanella stibiiresistens]|uniref:response regulator n=1 Tax=Skermanella stibiiresistens TaxID=913326 RepID=UPI0018DC1801|nr:response regulator [Skermanella stibiiresistens]
MAVKPNTLLAERSILVVDDERFTRALVARLLGYLGAKAVFQAENGADALWMLEGGRMAFDAVVADLEMPRVNGLEMLKEIRSGANGCRRDLPVVMLTGHSDIELVSRAMALDINGFIVKPVSQGALASRLARVFGDDVRTIRAESEYAMVDARFGADEPAPARGGLPVRPPPSPPPSPDGGMYRIALTDVAPGGVLALDVTVPSGLVLVSEGTVLTSRLIQRLKGLGDLNIVIEDVWLRV